MRNAHIHGYFDVDWEAVWGVVARDIAPLKEAIESILRAEGEQRREYPPRCRTLDTGCEVNLRTEDLWQLVPGEIARVQPKKIWRFKRHTYLAGAILSRRPDIPALGLVPLKLEPQGIWEPADEYWGEKGEPLENWAVPIVARGPRPSFEMEQVIPG